MTTFIKRSYDMINKLDEWGVKFEKDETGEYNVKKVHHMGTYVLPMPEGHHMKKILYRQLRKKRVQVINRYMATRLFKGSHGRIAAPVPNGTRSDTRADGKTVVPPISSTRPRFSILLMK